MLFTRTHKSSIVQWLCIAAAVFGCKPTKVETSAAGKQDTSQSPLVTTTSVAPEAIAGAPPDGANPASMLGSNPSVESNGHDVKVSVAGQQQDGKASAADRFTHPAHLQRYGLKAKGIAGDGNCLFRAVADQLQHHCGIPFAGPGALHSVLRRIAANYMITHAQAYKEFTQGQDAAAVDREFARRIEQDKTWGGDVALDALHKALKINIAVLHSVIRGQSSPPRHYQQPDNTQTIYLYYTSSDKDSHVRNHYESLHIHGRTEAHQQARMELRPRQGHMDASEDGAAAKHITDLIESTASALQQESVAAQKQQEQALGSRIVQLEAELRLARLEAERRKQEQEEERRFEQDGLRQMIAPFHKLSHTSIVNHSYTARNSIVDKSIKEGYSYGGLLCYVSLENHRLLRPLFRLRKDKNKHFFTSDPAEMESSLEQGYKFLRIACYVSPQPYAGLVELRRFRHPTHNLRYAASAEESEAARKAGYQEDGSVGFVRPSEATKAEQRSQQDEKQSRAAKPWEIEAKTLKARLKRAETERKEAANKRQLLKAMDHSLYRMFHPSMNDHFYTMDYGQVVQARDQGGYAKGYVLEGAACRMSSTPRPDLGLVPIFRLWRGGIRNHFYTNSEQDRANAINKWDYTDEGIVGYLSPDPRPGLVPIYRLFNRDMKNHCYTASQEEQQAAIKEHGYEDQGILGYVKPTK